MNPQIFFILFLITCFGYLLISEKLRPDVGALILLVILGLSGLVSLEEMFSGFSRSAVITILSIFIITNALEKTGATSLLARQLNHMAGKQEVRAVFVIMVSTALLSLVMNTIAAAAVLLPAVIGLSRQNDLRPSKLLIPLSFAALLGGMATIYTTANILISTALVEQGYQPYGIFDFIPIGLPMAIIGILFMTYWGRRILPSHGLGGDNRPQPASPHLSETYHLTENITAVYVLPDSNLSDLSLAKGQWGKNLGLNVIGISRGGKIILAPSMNEKVISGDIVLFTGNLSQVDALHLGLVFTEDPDWKGDLISEQVTLIEVILAPRSTVAGKTLRELHFREKYDLTILAVWREGLIIRDNLAEIPLKFGDTLLLQGSQSRTELIRRETDFIVLDEDKALIKNPRKIIVSLCITLSAVILPAINILPIAESAFSAAILMVITNCISIDDAYAAIEWKTIFLIAAMLPLGSALTNSGAAEFLGNHITRALGDLGPLAILGGFFLLATFFTQIITGQATAVILSSIAIAASKNVGIDPHGMAMAVALGCSMAFMTPFGHATNLLVMAPGGYSVKDYTRVGLPLTAVLFVVMLIGSYFYWVV